MLTTLMLLTGIVLLPVAQYLCRGNRLAQKTAVFVACISVLAACGGYYALAGLAPGDSWLGIGLATLVPFGLVLLLSGLAAARERPVFILLVTPLVFLAGFFGIVLAVVEAGLLGPPY